MLSAASPVFSHFQTLYSLFPVGFVYNFQICSADKNPHFYVLSNEIINAISYCKLDLIRGKLRLRGDCVLLTTLYLFIEKDIWR